MRVLRALQWDVRLQYRHGFHAAYGFVVATYVVLLRLIPEPARGVALPPVLLSEAAIVGFFFAGTMLHMDRAAGTLDALGMTPLRAGEYVLVRALSLSVLNVAAAVAIAAGAGGLAAPLLLAVAAALTGSIFACLGTGVAARVEGLERFVVRGGIASMLLGLPVLPYLGALESPLWGALPTQPALTVLSAGTLRGATALATLASVAALIVWCALTFLLARHWLGRHAAGWSGAIR
jgi:fluoroquinolone transport system permease protein